jgi:RND family efflux transporter MFP subunit
MTPVAVTGRFWPGVMALLVLGLTSACGVGTPDARQEFRVPVSVATLAEASVEDTVAATGELRAEEEALLRAEVRGSLEIARHAGQRLREGDRVRVGQVIAYLRGEDAALEARLPAFRRRLEEARARHAAKRTLADQGLISALDYQASQAELAVAENDFEQAQLVQGRTTLRAPLAGILANLARNSDGTVMADGQRVEPGLVVAAVLRLDTVVAQLSVPSGKALRLASGQAARLRHHGYDERVFEGRVQRIAPVIDPLTRTLRVEVAVPNAGGWLRPGMFVRAELVVERREKVLVLPRAALLERGNRPVVFVLEGSRVVQREPRLGLSMPDVVEVRAGLKRGEQVVVRGHETLTNGSQVRAAVDP